MTDTQSLVEHYIEDDRNCLVPAEARLRHFGVHVWAIVGYYLNAARQDISKVAADYDIPREAVDAALAYYEQHRTSIDARLAENAASIT